MKNIKTTIAGIMTGLAGTALNLAAMFDGDPSTTWSWEGLIAIFAAFGLFFAKDHDK